VKRKKKCKNKLCTKGDDGKPKYFRPKDDDPDFVSWCSLECAQAIAKARVDKLRDNTQKALIRKQRKQKQQHNERKKEVKPLSHWLKITQAVFNEYIRKRDSADPCISCGTVANVQYCASHFRTRGAASQLRFSELNVHKACNKRCNLMLSGNIAGYRPRLINKIGLAAVEALEHDNSTKKWERSELEEIRKKYRIKIKELEK